MTRTILAIGIAALTAIASPVLAQDQSREDNSPPTAAPEKINQVVVYGNDPCPAGTDGEIVVCGRMSEDDRFRIPTALRANPNNPRAQSWTSRVQSIERVGRFGTDSCSPAGLGGFTGCLNQVVNNAYAERREARSTDWTTAVSAERRQRLEGIDARAAEVEAQVTADENARIARQSGAANAAEAATEAAAGVDNTPLPTPVAPPR